MGILLKNGWIVTAETVFSADLFIQGEKIAAIGQDLARGDGGEKSIDVSGRYVLPGGIDVHTHMDLDVGFSRAVDDFYDGTVAAACGGTTSIVDHMAFGPKGVPLHHQFHVYQGLAGGKAVIDYGFHGVAQFVDRKILEELEAMARDGVPSVKAYMTYNDRLNDGEILQILLKMKALGGITAFHCENHDVVEFLKKKYVEEGHVGPIYHARSRPNLAEAEAVERVLRLGQLAGDAPVYVVHLSTKEGLDAIRAARARGQKNIFAETCSQYLLLTEECYGRKDGLKYVMSPPLRTQEDCDALWEGLGDGSIQVVATDHCPFRYGVEKQLGKEDFTKCPNGAPGVEERLMLLYSEGVAKGRISLSRMASLLSSAPAKIYGLAPEKGALIPGADADLTILDPHGTTRITQERMHGASDYTAYEGMELSGSIESVWLRGREIVRDNQFLGKRGEGKFLFRKPYGRGNEMENCE